MHLLDSHLLAAFINGSEAGLSWASAGGCTVWPCHRQQGNQVLPGRCGFSAPTGNCNIVTWWRNTEPQFSIHEIHRPFSGSKQIPSFAPRIRLTSFAKAGSSFAPGTTGFGSIASAGTTGMPKRKVPGLSGLSGLWWYRAFGSILECWATKLWERPNKLLEHGSGMFWSLAGSNPSTLFCRHPIHWKSLKYFFPSSQTNPFQGCS